MVKPDTTLALHKAEWMRETEVLLAPHEADPPLETEGPDGIARSRNPI